MAIDLGSIGKSAVVGLLGKNLRRVAGNVGSVLRGGAQKNDSSDFGVTRSKFSTKMLSFPIDVATALKDSIKSTPKKVITIEPVTNINK